jgi:hypothetical protein
VTTWKRVQGDVNDTAVVDLHGIDAITGCTVVGHIWQDGVASENLTGSVTTAVATLTAGGHVVNETTVRNWCNEQYGKR